MRKKREVLRIVCVSCVLLLCGRAPAGPPTPLSCPADIDGSGQVDAADLAVVLDQWGTCPDPCPPSCPGDVDGNCLVNVDDLVDVLLAWGPCPVGACCFADGTCEVLSEGECDRFNAGRGGLLAEQSVEFIEPTFNSYAVTKQMRACVDADCTFPPGEPCDPFPDDGLITYVYTLTNAADSDNAIIGWVLDTLVAGAIVDAGVLAGDGVMPDEVLITNESSTVQWTFFSDPIDPGETSVELYVTSALGPAAVDATALGDFGLDTPGSCIGPAVEGDFCGGSSWQGPDTTCDPNPCGPILGACCLPDGTCEVLTQAQCEGSGAGPGGLLVEDLAEIVDPTFGSYTVAKATRACIDAACSFPGGGDSCDPFPDDGLITYVYRLTNDAGSTNPIIGWVLDTGVPGAIVAAGVLAGDGTAPDEVIVTNDSATVQWTFFSEPIAPGEMSVELYVTSALGPNRVDATVLGDFGIDAPTTCFGPAVEGDFCTGPVWQGPGTTCDPDPCTPIVGACCFPDGSCRPFSQADCQSAGGTFQGSGVTCEDAGCSAPAEPTAFQVAVGTLLGGTVESLIESDNDRVRVRSEFDGGQERADLRVTLSGPATTASRLDLTVEVSGSVAGVECTIFLRDVSASTWDVIDTFPLTNGDQQHSYRDVADPGAFVAADGTVRVRIRARDATEGGVLRVDQVQVIVTP
jgi:hypothetical protein